MLKQASRVADDRAELHADGFEMRLETFAAGGFQRTEQTVAVNLKCRVCGHGDTVEGGTRDGARNRTRKNAQPGEDILRRRQPADHN